MSAAERVEAVNAARHTLIQLATGLVVVSGVLFTVMSLWYTARTVETAQETTRIAQEGHITDRYTKAVEQLGSSQQDVRLGGIYALQRLAFDSPRDHHTIRNVLAAFVRGHDICPPAARKKTLPKPCTATPEELEDIPSVRLDADVLAALTIAPTLAFRYRADLSEVRFPRADLRNVNLSDAILRGADLRGADLHGANLTGADLNGADLTGASLGGANLNGVDLRGAFLNGVYLNGANLNGVDLRGAELRNLGGVSEQRVRDVAKVDEYTRF
ncbi:pentapeptide repeat-containing protein [Nonomuraea sp. NPDC059023]|uniref:pentapeptide repeat-containing protein n=1 Tax=unclassified Nonomuraea TaxID=2593643 RepID=UPI0036815BA1